MAKTAFAPGDFVRLRLSDRELEVTILQSHEPGIVLVKLDSGYNIGIPKEHILDSALIRKARPSKEPVAATHRANLPSLGLVVTGGTIASKLDPTTGAVAPLKTSEDFQRLYPELFEVANIEIEQPFSMLSANMTSKEWILLAETVKKLLDKPHIQGVIITHGTDTLHYTAAALSFSFKNLSKPIVLTYSQRSIDRASSDAHLNLKCAARMALSGAAEVMLVGHATMNDDFCYALLGTKVRKMHSSRRDTFKPINCGPIAKVWPNKVEFLASYTPRNNAVSELDAVFSDKVALVYFYPGQSPDILDYYSKEGYKAVVLMGTGFGHVANGDVAHSWIPAIKRVIAKGMVVAMTSQTLYGKTNAYVYAYGRALLEQGVVFLGDMLPETAFVKLSWIIGHRSWRTSEKIKEKLLENIAQEYSKLLTA